MFKFLVLILSLPLYVVKFVLYLFPTVFKIIKGAFEIVTSDKTLDDVNDDIKDFGGGFR